MWADVHTYIQEQANPTAHSDSILSRAASLKNGRQNSNAKQYLELGGLNNSLFIPVRKNTCDNLSTTKEC